MNKLSDETMIEILLYLRATDLAVLCETNKGIFTHYRIGTAISRIIQESPSLVSATSPYKKYVQRITQATILPRPISLYIIETVNILSALSYPQPLTGKGYWISTSWLSNAKRYYEAVPLAEMVDAALITAAMHHHQQNNTSKSENNTDMQLVTPTKHKKYKVKNNNSSTNNSNNNTSGENSPFLAYLTPQKSPGAAILASFQTPPSTAGSTGSQKKKNNYSSTGNNSNSSSNSYSSTQKKSRSRRNSDSLPPWTHINSDITCPHQGLASHKLPQAKRRAMDSKAWFVLRRYYPLGHSFVIQLTNNNTTTTTPSNNTTTTTTNNNNNHANNTTSNTTNITMNTNANTNNINTSTNTNISTANECQLCLQATEEAQHSATQQKAQILQHRRRCWCPDTLVSLSGRQKTGVPSERLSVTHHLYLVEEHDAQGNVVDYETLLLPASALSLHNNPTATTTNTTNTTNSTTNQNASSSTNNDVNSTTTNGMVSQSSSGTTTAAAGSRSTSPSSSTTATLIHNASSSSNTTNTTNANHSDVMSTMIPTSALYQSYYPLIPGTYHLISRDWVKAWRHYLRDVQQQQNNNNNNNNNHITHNANHSANNSKHIASTTNSSSGVTNAHHWAETPLPEAMRMTPAMDLTRLLCTRHGQLLVPSHLEDYLIGVKRSLVSGLSEYLGEIVEIVTADEWDTLQNLSLMHCTNNNSSISSSSTGNINNSYNNSYNNSHDGRRHGHKNTHNSGGGGTNGNSGDFSVCFTVDAAGQSICWNLPVCHVCDPLEAQREAVLRRQHRWL